MAFLGSYNGVDQGTYFPFRRPICLNSPSILLGYALTDDTGKATTTWSVPAIGPVQQYLSTQAVLVVGNNLMLSNSITAPIYQ